MVSGGDGRPCLIEIILSTDRQRRRIALQRLQRRSSRDAKGRQLFPPSACKHVENERQQHITQRRIGYHL